MSGLRKGFLSLLVKLERTSRNHLKPENEVVYQNIFGRDAAQLGIKDEFYPLGFAANYSLMYLVLRCVKTFPFKRIVELGAGQTSYLFSALASTGVSSAEMTTVESNTFWAEKVQARVGHKVQLAKMKAGQNSFGDYNGYDLASVTLPPSIDFLVVDGPPGAALGGDLARHAALELCGRLDPAGYVVIIDDAERPGEAMLVRGMLEALPKAHSGNITAAKKQVVIAGGAYAEAAYF